MGSNLALAPFETGQFLDFGLSFLDCRRGMGLEIAFDDLAVGL
jgi:hypothetical protein